MFVHVFLCFARFWHIFAFLHVFHHFFISFFFVSARRPRETKWTYDNERGAFTITTLHAIRGGAQVYDSYGQKCNHRFLLNYGFAIETNQEANGFCPNEVRRGGGWDEDVW